LQVRSLPTAFRRFVHGTRFLPQLLDPIQHCQQQRVPDGGPQLSLHISGASGSGKTTFTARLKKMLADIAVISLDMYNDGSKVREDNFDDPRIIDYDTLMHNISDLRAGKATKVPVYDFRQSKRVGYADVGVPASRIIIIEGIHALSAKLEPLLDLKIAITGGIHFDLVKRVCRRAAFAHCPSLVQHSIVLAVLLMPGRSARRGAGCKIFMQLLTNQ
jgi:Phosphoribulokinase / Uridine kinase family